ncbi:extracellular solute-binding protein family 1 [Beutenbergia cavernae DSM 12333]|uniref:Extracellular solute-binding protein family 1 n=1 Tax=Beutenbergia cavernae (strain ATCC BAA-8 / DSM 12333 / CCUG 43141 / JCM 11478 / NBRC 16432 / NCIMB 13614 / HKI 0122) TaxID=471853 RepID=C5C311_BEUC1|nr:ABC transporter substrate-binding protein [Beutenbergia cavernae]ACQ81855.1 extracellular solute-binding protein family 1 [Beutenbergia cavernae DSM 12333]
MRRATTRCAALGLAAAVALAAGACSQIGGGGEDESVTITLGVGTVDTVAEAIVEAFEEAHPDIDVEIETMADEAQTRTRLASGDLPDLFAANSGSYFHSLDPAEHFVPLTDEAFMERVDPAFQEVVTSGDDVYGVPWKGIVGGGFMYSRAIYDALGLEIPRTWDEFMANNAAISEAGITPVIQTYGEPWTAQMPLLANYFNVQSQVPDFAESYTANEVHFSDTPEALEGFENIQAIHDAGYQNENFASAAYEDGLVMLAEGEGAHYPILSYAIATIAQTHPDAVGDLGMFPVPGRSADVHGMTMWMPAGLYIPTSSDHVEEAKTFLEFLVGAEGCDVVNAQGDGGLGPQPIADCPLPEDAPQVSLDVESYLQDPETYSLALEYLSPVKGPALAQICVEVGSGTRTAVSGAELYDEDVEKQAQQLGLEGW